MLLGPAEGKKAPRALALFETLRTGKDRFHPRMIRPPTMETSKRMHRQPVEKSAPINHLHMAIRDLLPKGQRNRHKWTQPLK